MTVIMVSSSSCSPCRVMKPIFYDIAQEYPAANVKIMDVDTEEGLSIAKKHNINTLPSFVIQTESDTEVIHGAVAPAYLRRILNNKY